MKLKAKACRIEKIPEKEFNPALISEEWEVLWRGNGYIYIGYRLDFTEMRGE